jgi:hypothetical protein
MDSLQARAFTSSTEIITQIAAVQTAPDVVEPWRRIASVLLPLVGPLVGVGFGLLVAMGMSRLAQTTPGIDALRQALAHLKEVAARPGPEADRERHNLETYIAGTFRSTLTNPQLWTAPLMAGQVAPYRTTIDRLLAAHPSVSPEELTVAKASLGKFLDEQEKDFSGQQRRSKIASRIVGVIMTLFGLGTVAVLGVIFAAAFRGGLLLRIFGLAVVDARGRRATRSRAWLRALVAWAPAIALIALTSTFPALYYRDAAEAAAHKSWFVINALPAIVFIAGGIVAALRPARGWQDRIARTFIVPR